MENSSIFGLLTTLVRKFIVARANNVSIEIYYKLLMQFNVNRDNFKRKLT